MSLCTTSYEVYDIYKLSVNLYDSVYDKTISHMVLFAEKWYFYSYTIFFNILILVK